MKKLLFIIVLGIFLFEGAVQAKVEEMVTQVGDLKVRLTMEMTGHDGGHNPSMDAEHHNSMGTNEVDINIYDSEGKAVTDAKIKIGYSMSAQANMPPMEYTSRAKLDGETYKADLNFSMKGNWEITVYIMRTDKDIAKANFKMHVM